MNKLISLILAVIMAAALCVNASALWTFDPDNRENGRTAGTAQIMEFTPVVLSERVNGLFDAAFRVTEDNGMEIIVSRRDTSVDYYISDVTVNGKQIDNVYDTWDFESDHYEVTNSSTLYITIVKPQELMSPVTVDFSAEKHTTGIKTVKVPYEGVDAMVSWVSGYDAGGSMYGDFYGSKPGYVVGLDLHEYLNKLFGEEYYDTGYVIGEFYINDIPAKPLNTIEISSWYAYIPQELYGEEEITVSFGVNLIGDCNGDDKINNKDVVTLFKFISSDAMIDNQIIQYIFDFNIDDNVNNKDVVSLFKYINR